MKHNHARYGGTATLSLLSLAALLCQTGWSADLSTTTALTVSQNAVTVPKLGQPSPVRLTATVTAGGKPVVGSSVQFCLATVKSCFGSALIGQATVGKTGTASINKFFSNGMHSVKAVYLGRSGFLPSNSLAQTVTVTGIKTSTGLSASGSGQSFQLTASVQGNALTPLTGNVSFMDLTAKTTLATGILGKSSTALNFSGLAFPSNGSEPLTVAAADFNNDGYADVAFANLNTGNLEVLSVHGAVSNVIELSTGAPSSIAVGDFDGDGNLDIAVTSETTNSVTIYLGQGNLNFAAGATFSTGGFGPSAVVAADFNRDGLTDLAVTNLISGTVSILQNTGGGAFTMVNQITTDSFPQALVAADFNGDGNIDIATANYYGFDVTVLAGDGNFGFKQVAQPAADIYPDSIAVDDFNGDGKPDLAVANQYSGDVTVLLGKGDGTFTPSATAPLVGASLGGITTGDFNQDGIEDLAVTSFGSNSVTVVLGRGDGTFAASSGPIWLQSGATPHALAAGDFSGAGYPDLAVANSGNNSISILLDAVSTIANITSGSVTLVPGHTIVAEYLGSASYYPSSTELVVPIPPSTSPSAK